jgi:hypothetical protein
MNALLASLVLLVVPAAAPQGQEAAKSLPQTAATTSIRTDVQQPDVIIMDKIHGCYGSVRFDHRLHVKMSSMGGSCESCHHHNNDERGQASAGDVIKPCRECHEVNIETATIDMPGLKGAYHRQCLSCHRDWQHENGCGFCHTDTAAVRPIPAYQRSKFVNPPSHAAAQATYVYQTSHKPLSVVTFHHADHTEKFGLKCANCHGGTSCGQCHGGDSERPVVNRQQSCYKCHGETRCQTCHNLQEREHFDHSRHTGWRLRPGHASLPCTSCHGIGQMPARPTSDGCRACHAQKYGDGEFDHGRTGVELTADHAYFECIDCHSGGDDRMLARCCGCHTEKEITGKRTVGPGRKVQKGGSPLAPNAISSPAPAAKPTTN